PALLEDGAARGTRPMRRDAGRNEPWEMRMQETGLLVSSGIILDDKSKSFPIAQAGPIVFVLDDDVSVRKSLELLIDSAGWQAETCASAQEFLSWPRV